MKFAHCRNLSSSLPSDYLNPAKNMVHEIQWILPDCLL